MRLATAAGKTDTFLGERYRRIGRRRGKKKALVAVGRSLLVVIRHLLSAPAPGSTTSVPVTTTPASTPNNASATTSANAKPSAPPSPCSPPHRPPTAFHPSAHTLVGR
ncbi:MULTISPECIES: hypothetical protein [unclassified Streptomyces]|uniref:hypothetical protein n=1 Tax=unclassified Streptomyces TaxID=2593676 RepID=UPI002251F185|nr:MULTISPECIES: hypothetical protein [unclassified Streptomyces]MCX5049299.1 hypothetical protein [Streptomyces sp. NBC_00474]